MRRGVRKERFGKSVTLNSVRLGKRMRVKRDGCGEDEGENEDPRGVRVRFRLSVMVRLMLM